ncbi:short-chain dehydrogenase reductase SDR [Paucilactobacillus vaccinostercus DSM 20634]|uniref:Short-chain dehydrogenase reductase SDR n=1 Tax=Paucilactobacillus vaccinostercus DSM 20634 TaxID=1423813 RepID=A0A0R2A1B7_9LACO|nr:SDR family NAD(P)-dependent oxidoreductase [Paucilactobacillus vaccinostercus]KRM60357.1 short-chain dehydrogenase reductase SDR [Paucilactobacillus vaccinostercus DSM 20634]
MKKVALVTGANRGIGYEITRQLAQHGYQVVMACRNVAQGTAAKQTLVDAGIEATLLDVMAIDLNDLASIEAAGQLVATQYPDLELLVNNAGIAGDMAKRALETTTAEIQTTLDVNLMGTFNLIKALVPTLRHNNGQIANLTGPASATVFYHPLAYSVSKYALNGLIQLMAADFIQHEEPLSIYGIFPGGVSTDINHHMQGPFMKTVEVAGQLVVDLLLDGQEHNGEILAPDGTVISQVQQ